MRDILSFMSDAITIDGQEFVSAKRASKETGYTRDYIGQLARGGHISARRIEGLWYVSLESLHTYRTKAEEYKSEPPVSTPSLDADAGVVFDGKEYVSASRGAGLTGYHQDYVGQLARTGKVASRQMGNRWFVERDALLSHKKEKDALLAAVQAESVGLGSAPAARAYRAPATFSPPVAARAAESIRKTYAPVEPFFTYLPEGGDLMPKPAQAEPLPTIHRIRTVPSSDDALHRAFEPAQMRDAVARSYSARSHTQAPLARRSIPIQHKPSVRLVHIAPIALTIVVVLALGFTSLRQKAVYAVKEVRGGGAQVAAAANARSSVASAAQWLEKFFSQELVYQAQK